MNSSPEFNLFIKQKEIEKIIKSKDDISTAYIILLNNELQSKHQKVSTTFHKLETMKEELEEYNDKLEKSKAHIQGIAKNQYLISQEKTKLITFYKTKFQDTNKQKLLNNLLTIPYLLILIRNIQFKTTIALVVIISTYQIQNIIKHFKQYKNIKDVLEIEDNVKKLDQSNDYIFDIIDNS